MDLRNIVKMTEIKKVNSLEELEKQDIVETKIVGEKTPNKMLLRRIRKPWYTFIGKDNNGKEILDISIAKVYNPVRIDKGIIEINLHYAIWEKYLPSQKGYDYRKRILKNKGLWGALK